MKQGKTAYHTIIVEVAAKTPFTPVDFQFPAHHKVCTGLMIEASLEMSDFDEGQLIGDLALEFHGETLNFHQGVRYCVLPHRFTHFWDFQDLDVKLKPNTPTMGHFTNEAVARVTEPAQKEGEADITSLKLLPYTLTLTFRCTT